MVVACWFGSNGGKTKFAAFSVEPSLPAAPLLVSPLTCTLMCLDRGDI